MPPKLDGTSDMADFPPRGSGHDGVVDTMPSALWADPDDLTDAFPWKAGDLLLGKWQERPIGYRDDRHAVLIAGSRAGKTRSVLIPNLRTYPGSAIVIDPKGELARETAAYRARPKAEGGMGQAVYILDPFGVSGFKSSAHNPFDELIAGPAGDIAANAAQLAEALIIAAEGAKDPHWTDSARNLVRGLVLYLLSTPDETRSLRRLRELLHLNPDERKAVFTAMSGSDAFDGVLANIGAEYQFKCVVAEKHGGAELASIYSTAQTQTAPLDDVAAVTDHSAFDLGRFKDTPSTLYVVLPAMRMGTHYRWLRLVVQLAMQAMERTPFERGRLPVWFVLEEFPILGHMRSIETAAGFMAGFGVKLVAVIQDLSQLQTHYPKSWETFLGNAGVVVAFGNADMTTAEYLSKRLGQARISEWRAGESTSGGIQSGRAGKVERIDTAPLLAADEIMIAFSRLTGRLLALMPGQRPIYMQRLRGPEDTPA